MKVFMTVNIILYGGITIIIIGLILYFVADYMVKYYDKQIKKHTFEIVQPKIKGKNENSINIRINHVNRLLIATFTSIFSRFIKT